MASLIDLDYSWEAERRRRISYLRRKSFAKWFAWIVYAACIALAIGAVALLVCVHANQERLERAAYNEGRYGVDRATAMAMADDGIGMCAEELIDDYRAVRAARGPYHVATNLEVR